MHENIKENSTDSIWKICNKIRKAVCHHSIHLWDYFIPLDPDRKNLISESDFIIVLSESLGKLIDLSNQEVSELIDFFHIQDGRIFYTQFCNIIQEDRKDTNYTNCLTMFEEKKLKAIIRKIAFYVNQWRVLLKPYFEEYELISMNCGVITFRHFRRILRFLDIIIEPDEMNLLIKKFCNNNYTVNYVMFLQNIQEMQTLLLKKNQVEIITDIVPGRIVPTNPMKLNRPEIDVLRTSCIFPEQLHFLSIDTSSKRLRNIEEIMLRIQEYAIQSQLRVAHHFQDFDVCNSGKITENQFRRGLDALRKSPHGDLYLSEKEIRNLISFYKDPNNNERFCWRAFENDVEEVFTKRYIDTKSENPNCKVVSPPVQIKELNRIGYGEWDCSEIYSKLSTKMEKIYLKTLKKITLRLKQRRFSLRQYFRDFDKNHRGYVCRSHLRQIFKTAMIPITLEEMLSLECIYNDNIGFYYLDFINKLETLSEEKPLLKKAKVDVSDSIKCLSLEETDIDLILAKLKSEVVRNGIKVNEFIRLFDTRNERIVTKWQFDRGLNQLKCNLTRSEVNTLMDKFKNSQRPNYIDYWKFCDEVEAAITQGQLEKSPMMIPARHVPTKNTPRSCLNFNEQQILKRTLTVISRHFNSNLEELFKDYDKHLNIGSITRNELLRVLSIRKVIYTISAIEFDVLFKCFTVGHTETEPRFDYLSFLNSLYTLQENKTF